MRKLDPSVIAHIHALGRAGRNPYDIALELGVSASSVRRHMGLAGTPPTRAEPKNPLYDPRRDGVPEQPLTAKVCGDPHPGRRELVARNSQGPEHDPPWGR